jgi:hypothetical protein
MLVHDRGTRDRAQPRLSVLLIFVLVFDSLIGITVASGQSTDKYSFQIESEDAFPDSTLPQRLRSYFDDDNDSPLECASIDLNGDGKNEKFIPNKLLQGTGLCPWLIFDSKLKQLLGRIDAKIIFILKSKRRGYADLECYCRVGGGLGAVTLYAFNGREYKEISSLELKDEQIDTYFGQRRNVPHPKWLRPGE